MIRRSQTVHHVSISPSSLSSCTGAVRADGRGMLNGVRADIAVVVSDARYRMQSVELESKGRNQQ